MVDRWKYGNYHIESVYNRLTPEMQARIIAFWERHDALPEGDDPQQRAREVVLVASDAGGEVVGVNTVYPGRLGSQGPLFFFYRQFIQPADRVFGMMRFMTMRAWEVLRDLDMADKPQGVVIVAENRKLMRPGLVALFESRGWRCIGKGRELDVWLKNFR